MIVVSFSRRKERKYVFEMPAPLGKDVPVNSRLICSSFGWMSGKPVVCATFPPQNRPWTAKSHAPSQIGRFISTLFFTVCRKGFICRLIEDIAAGVIWALETVWRQSGCNFVSFYPSVGPKMESRTRCLNGPEASFSFHLPLVWHQNMVLVVFCMKSCLVQSEVIVPSLMRYCGR